MQELQRLISATVYWIVVPIVMLSIFTFSLYSYISIAAVREFTLSVALGVGLGALFHIIVMPTSVKEMFD